MMGRENQMLHDWVGGWLSRLSGMAARQPLRINPMVWGMLLWMMWLGVGHTLDSQGFPMDSGEQVTMDFQGVELRQVIRFVAEMVGKNYVVDPAVKGKVTVVTPSPVTIAEAEKIFASILSVHHLTIIERDGAFKIVPEKEGRSESNAAILPEGHLPGERETVVSRLVRVENVASSALVNTLKPLMHIWGSLTSHLPSNSLIVTDASATVARIVTLINAMDVPPELAVHRLFPLKYAPVAQLEKLINSVFAAFNSKQIKSAPKVKVFSDNRTNILVIVAPEEQLREVKRLLVKLDKPVQRGKGNLHLYYPKNGKAEVIAKVLNDLISKAQAGRKKSTGALKPLQFLRQVNVVGEKETNTMVIAATAEDYETLLPILEGLDMRRLQVHVEALIIEVSAKRSAQFGVEWGIANVPGISSTATTGFGGSSFGNVGNPGINPLSSGGLSVGLLRGGSAVVEAGTTAALVPGVAALVQAVQGDVDVNVLATPNIITMENEEAEIVSGENVPILTGTTQSTVSNPTNTYERKDVGLILRITPQVIEEGWLRLKIFQERSSVSESNVVGTTEGLITTKKDSIQTVVTLKSGQTVVLGGLINAARSGTVDQVPCLGGIFGVGELFSSTTRKQDKTNLMIFINPTIINTYADLLGISEKKYQESRTFWNRKMDNGSRLIPNYDVDELSPFLNHPLDAEIESDILPLLFEPATPKP